MARQDATSQRFQSRQIDYSILQASLTDQISVTDTFNPNTNPFTLLMWAKINVLPLHYTPANDANFFSQQDGTGTGRSWLFVAKTTNQIFTNIRGTGDAFNFYPIAGRWHRYALTKIGTGASTTLTLYVDGVLIGTATGAVSSASGNFIIGNNKASSGGPTAQFTDVAVTALGHNPTQIAADYYNNSFPAFPVFTRFRLQMTEGSGTTIADTSGNGRNGTITGGTWAVDSPCKSRTNLSVARQNLSVVRQSVL